MTKSEDIYNRPELYDLVNGNGGSDVDFFVEEAQRLGGEVLELGCGTGRILNVVAAKTGLPCTGIDLSTAMIQKAQENSRSMKSEVEYLVGDMSDFSTPKKFKLIYVAMNSLLHLHQRPHYEKFFACVRKALTVDGRLILSVLNPSVHILSRDSSQRFPVDKFTDPKTQQRITIEETTSYDPIQQIATTTWYYSNDKEKDFYSHTYSLRMLFPEELQTLVHYNDFSVESIYGDCRRKAFAGNDRLQILCLK